VLEQLKLQRASCRQNSTYNSCWQTSWSTSP